MGKVVAIELAPPQTISTKEWTEYLLTLKRLSAILKLQSALSERLDLLNKEVAALQNEVENERAHILLTLEQGGEIEQNARVSVADMRAG